MPRETEAKIALKPGEIGALRIKLSDAGARRGPVDDELNIVFNLQGAIGRRRLRLRIFGGRSDALLTCKGPAAKEPAYKSREEVEVHVSDAAAAWELFDHLGFRPKARYDKRREHWFLGDTIVALDQLAFGDFLEVEGEEQAISGALITLGLRDRPHLRAGYARLSRLSAKTTAPKQVRPLSTAPAR